MTAPNPSQPYREFLQFRVKLLLSSIPIHNGVSISLSRFINTESDALAKGVCVCVCDTNPLVWTSEWMALNQNDKMHLWMGLAINGKLSTVKFVAKQRHAVVLWHRNLSIWFDRFYQLSLLPHEIQLRRIGMNKQTKVSSRIYILFLFRLSLEMNTFAWAWHAMHFVRGMSNEGREKPTRYRLWNIYNWFFQGFRSTRFSLNPSAHCLSPFFDFTRNTSSSPPPSCLSSSSPLHVYSILLMNECGWRFHAIRTNIFLYSLPPNNNINNEQFVLFSVGHGSSSNGNVNYRTAHTYSMRLRLRHPRPCINNCLLMWRK